jgi:hypothetical protein
VKIEVTEFSDDEASDGWGEPVGTRKQYRHVKFKAHYDELCRKDHNPRTALPYNPLNPQAGGCLLDPRRLTYRDIMAVKDKNPRLFAVSYQQEDIDPAQVLVNPLWVDGGQDAETGEVFPGCWDKTRSMGVIPTGLTPPLISYVTADPSPTKYWSIQWWVYQPSTQTRFLIDHARKSMGANDFVDYIISRSAYEGLLEDWWQIGNAAGLPFTHVIVEQNAAQRWLMQYQAATQWATLRHVTYIPHDTYANKTSPQFGVQALIPQIWKYGKVNLPTGDNTSRGKAMGLVREVTRYPESSTTDCVMAQWFGEVNLPMLLRQVERSTRPVQMPQKMISSRDMAGMQAMF